MGEWCILHCFRLFMNPTMVLPERNACRSSFFMRISRTEQDHRMMAIRFSISREELVGPVVVHVEIDGRKDRLE